MKSVKLQSGDMSSNETERQERWQEHFVEVFQAEMCDDLSSLSRDNCPSTDLPIAKNT